MLFTLNSFKKTTTIGKKAGSIFATNGEEKEDFESVL